VAAAVLGGAHIVRVHDVLEMVQVIRVCDALLEVSS
jgi:dihydropteroate synthase